MKTIKNNIMFSLPYVYLYIISSVLVLSIRDTMEVINPANPFVKPIMGMIGLITKIANLILLILCIFFAPHWWYVPIMWVCGVILSVFIKFVINDRADMVLGYVAVICAPICTMASYFSLF